MAKLPNLKGTHNILEVYLKHLLVVITLAKLPNLKGTHNEPTPVPAVT
ncbi:hypothetical protein [Chishuiella sp.]